MAIRVWRGRGSPSMLVFASGAMDKPAHFVLVNWRDDQISVIRDFLFAPVPSNRWTGLAWADQIASAYESIHASFDLVPKSSA